MTAKSKTKANGKTAPEKSADPQGPYDTPAAQAESLKALESFHALYPAPVINMLRDTILEHVGDKLEAAGLKAEKDLLGNDLFALRWLSEVYAGGTPTVEQAHELMRFFGMDGLHETVSKVVRILAENDGWNNLEGPGY
jgi:hypothetical protein